MVIDCFPFFNELDILKLHLSIMDPLVDRFVIEEARYTFSGQPKELCFEANKEMFEPWLSKIQYVVVDECKEELDTHLRDKFQKNHLLEGLRNVHNNCGAKDNDSNESYGDISDDDIIILGDVDEIPNPDVIAKIIESFDNDKVYHLAQRMFYCYLNMEEVSGKLLSITGEFPQNKRIPASGQGIERAMWLGTKVFSKKSIPESGIIEIREFPVEDDRSVRVPNGGWHFGYMGSHHETDVVKRVGTKVVAAAHQEYNSEDILKEVKDRLFLGEDIFGREASFLRVEIDDSFPKFLRDNSSEYDYLIMPKVSVLQKKFIPLKMKVFRFGRRCRRKIKRTLGIR